MPASPNKSGFFAVAAGALLLLSGLFLDPEWIHEIPRDLVFRLWLGGAGVALTYWGAMRIHYGTNTKGAWIVGQSTIAFVFGTIATTIALYGLLFGSPP